MKEDEWYPSRRQFSVGKTSSVSSSQAPLSYLLVQEFKTLGWPKSSFEFFHEILQKA